MTTPALQVLAQIFTERLLNTAVEGIFLVGIVWLLLRVIGRQNSGTRFAIWLSALLAVVALPFLSGLGAASTHSGIFPGTATQGKIILSASWAYCLFAAWGIGSALSLLGLGIGLRRVHQIRKRCCEVDQAALDPAIAATLRDCSARRSVKLCVSRDVVTPAAIGFFGPAIVFPEGLLEQLAPEEIKVILLHELAHLRRWDDWTNLAQKIVKAVFFFHPAVWWIENRLTLEREMACDDMVLAQSTSAKAYASSLISFAEKLQNVRTLALAQSLVSRVCQMSLRVAHILETRPSNRTGLWTPVLGVSATMLALVLGAATYAPRIVAFEAPTTLPRAHQGEPAQQTAKNEAPLKSADAAVARTLASNVTRPAGVASRPRVIAAAFHPRRPAASQRLKQISSRKPLPVRAQAVQENLPPRETFVILQTARYDASGSAVWTLCVWKIGGENQAEKQWESAIVLNLI
jgi:beta-lactamase regulating signal transducer with metallopeptidase domain